jgi:hypothetical protein
MLFHYHYVLLSLSDVSPIVFASDVYTGMPGQGCRKGVGRPKEKSRRAAAFSKAVSGKIDVVTRAKA